MKKGALTNYEKRNDKKAIKSNGKLVYVTPDKKERMYARSYYE